MNAFQIECARDALQNHFGTATTLPDEDGYEVGYLVEQGYDYDVAVAAVQAWWDLPALLQRQKIDGEALADAILEASGRFKPVNEE